MGFGQLPKTIPGPSPILSELQFMYPVAKGRDVLDIHRLPPLNSALPSPSRGLDGLVS